MTTIVEVIKDNQTYQVWLEGGSKIKPGHYIRIDGGKKLKVTRVFVPNENEQR